MLQFDTLTTAAAAPFLKLVVGCQTTGQAGNIV